MGTLQSILVPLDGSPPSIAALDHALVLASDYDARIDVLHILPPSNPLGPSAQLEAERAVDIAVERAWAALGVRLTRRTISGDPLRAIVEAAHGFDLIVMGTHGWSGRLRALLGSVAEGVVRNAPCPVLTVRDASPGYESFAERRHGRPTLANQSRAH
jgi:nucleotide-binding universal stress UspA family protein